MTAPAADMRQAAAVAGLSYERFRKVWPTWVRTRGFPAPYETNPYRWRPERLQAWREAREALQLHQILHAPGANDDAPPADQLGAPPPPIRKGRVAAGRARMMQRMGASR